MTFNHCLLSLLRSVTVSSLLLFIFLFFMTLIVLRRACLVFCRRLLNLSLIFSSGLDWGYAFWEEEQEGQMSLLHHTGNT